MRHLSPGNHQQMERPMASEIRAISTTYCSHCHLSTPKQNPRCIHCRRPLTDIPQRDRESANSSKSLLTLSLAIDFQASHVWAGVVTCRIEIVALLDN